jgi:hypothetical protein
VVQERPGLADFYVVKGPRFSEKHLDDLLQIFRGRLGSDFAIAAHVVDRIDGQGPVAVEGTAQSER